MEIEVAVDEIGEYREGLKGTSTGDEAGAAAKDLQSVEQGNLI